MATEALLEVPLLGQMAQGYTNNEYIARRVLTEVKVGQTIADYIEWAKEPTYDVPETLMVLSGTPNEITIKGAQKRVYLQDDALRDWIDPREEEQAGGAWNVQVRKTNNLANGIQLRWENDSASKLTDPNVVTANETLNGNTQLDNPAVDPIKYFRAKAAAMLKQPNILVLGRPVFDAVVVNPLLKDYFKYTTGGVITEEMLASAIGVEEVIVGRAYKNAAPKGQPLQATYIWGKNSLLAYRAKEPASPLMDQATVGYLPIYKGDKGRAWRVYVGRDPLRGTGEGSQFVKVELTKQIVVSGASLAFLTKAAVS